MATAFCQTASAMARFEKMDMGPQFLTNLGSKQWDRRYVGMLYRDMKRRERPLSSHLLISL
jgi:hypothetical protein